MASGHLLFVSGHDPEADGRLVYRGRVGRDLSLRHGAAAARLATANALASAVAAAGSRGRLRRCLALTCFVDAGPAMDRIAPRPFLDPALSLIDAIVVARGRAAAPVVWLRWAQGLAGGMPVEVELLLELAGAIGDGDGGDGGRVVGGGTRERRLSGPGVAAARRGRLRFGRRTS